jgi:hypothetical protein
MTQQTAEARQALRPREDEYILEAEKQETLSGAAANLFDLRMIIGALFVVYGVVLVVLGLFDSPAEVAKSAGVRINLWTGIGMLALAAVFLTWVKLRPLTHELARAAEAQRDFPAEPEGTAAGRPVH